ncbi:DUF86 domain-containing protein [Oligella urethralis]|uniref:HepT-like ribonuclease domain-containing protein n=1 Tax=Oligella urethralis TaxID=90245 RepID=UPI000E02E0DD|nr:HepT-like ribonuclease domain-containing protein [Oligella urethralis]SUA57490.1 Uncharacterized conserved protein [Oligella urethralis]
MNKFDLYEQIEHIKEYAEAILKDTDDIQEEEFRSNRLLQRSLTLDIITLGEIAAVISLKFPDFVKNNKTLPWKDMAAMRHKMVHGYYTIDLAIVWDTVKQDIPRVLESIPQLRKDVIYFNERNLDENLER